MQEPVQAAEFPEVSPVLNLLIDGLKSALHEQLIGIYLYGSLVTGDFDPAISDIDLAVVLTCELNDDTFQALHQLHTHVVALHPSWNDRLELAYISREALQSFRTRTSTIGIISPGEPFHRLQAGADWLISWYALREDGIALHGPAIKTILDPVSNAEYLNAVRDHIQNYREFVKEAPTKQFLSYIVLTVARGAYTLEHRHVASKIRAAAWAKCRFPRWSGLIENAMDWRRDPESDELTKEQVRPQVEAYVIDMLSGSAGTAVSDEEQLTRY